MSQECALCLLVSHIFYYEKSEVDGLMKTIKYPKSRMEQLQEEFHMSKSEVDGLAKFISSQPSRIGILEVIERMIKSDDLNIRQKVAFAHIMGIFRAEDVIDTRIRSSQDL